MKIVFCITCKGRTAHIKKTLAQNISDNPGANVVFVLLDYNDGGELAYHIQNTCQEHIQSGKLVYYQYRESVAFRMAHAKNMAHRLGILNGADILVNLDADNRTGQGFAEYIEEYFTRTKNDPQEIFLWSRMIKGELKRGVTGRIACSKNAFLISGGYDERYTTYSPDDKDFEARLRRLGYCAQEVDKRFLNAVYHDDETRFKEYPHLLQGGSWLAKLPYDICCISPHNRVVNCGRIGCGIVFKNFCEVAIEIKPVPTRIFGIGFSKTATTSLAEALRILGLHSGHWENPRWARQIWADILHMGSSGTLEKYYALTDLPLALIYKELDEAYPNSKFILTVREEVGWLRSIQNHFKHETNPFRKDWENDAFTHRLHQELYGRKSFDLDVFLARYRRHNAEVMEHFKHRPESLLVMDMGHKNHWERLCRFLDMPLPACDYPRELVTKGNE